MVEEVLSYMTSTKHVDIVHHTFMQDKRHSSDKKCIIMLLQSFDFLICQVCLFCKSSNAFWYAAMHPFHLFHSPSSSVMQSSMTASIPSPLFWVWHSCLGKQCLAHTVINWIKCFSTNNKIQLNKTCQSNGPHPWFLEKGSANCSTHSFLKNTVNIFNLWNSPNREFMVYC